MRLDLEAAHDAPFEWEESLELEQGVLRQAGVRLLGEIDSRGTVFHSSPDYIVRGRLHYEQRLQCTRCMERYDQEVESEFDLVAQVQGRGEPGDEIELEESDLDVVLLSEPSLETESLIVEQIELLLPMKPLCSDGCKGLCAGCGVDLNREPCSCSGPADTRFSGLLALKQRLEEGD
ncbi:MAG: DUF177 domain-containing protein [Acidobacteriota bacterium]